MLQAEEHVQRPGGRRQRGAFEELKETQLVKGALAPAQSGDERPHGGGVKRGGLKAIIKNMTILRHWGGGWIGRDLSQGHFVFWGVFLNFIYLFMLAAPGLNCNRQDL